MTTEAGEKRAAFMAAHLDVAANIRRLRRSMRYAATLSEDMLCVTRFHRPSNRTFSNAWLSIYASAARPDATRIIVRNLYSWDECTGVPNARGTYRASCVHDAIYQYAGPIAKEWGCSVAAVLRWADAVFLEMMLADKANPVTACIYFLGVTIFGYSYHQSARAVRWVFGRSFNRKQLDSTRGRH